MVGGAHPTSYIVFKNKKGGAIGSALNIFHPPLNPLPSREGRGLLLAYLSPSIACFILSTPFTMFCIEVA